jgi:hypothetical protein
MDKSILTLMILFVGRICNENVDDLPPDAPPPPHNSVIHLGHDTHADNPNTTQTLEYTKDKYNMKIIKQRVSPKVPPTTYKG